MQAASIFFKKDAEMSSQSQSAALGVTEGSRRHSVRPKIRRDIPGIFHGCLIDVLPASPLLLLDGYWEVNGPNPEALLSCLCSHIRAFVELLELY